MLSRVSNAAAVRAVIRRTVINSNNGSAGSIARSIHTRRKVKDAVNLPPALFANLPKKKVEPAIEAEDDPDAYKRSPVTSAHAIDVETGKISTQDSVAVSPSGSVVHGRYGDLPDDLTAGVPLEYLALLRMAAEGAAAVRAVGSKKGTMLVWGASQANGFAAVQLGTAAGHAVVGVVDAQHSCNEDITEYVKGMIPEPGTAVAEEYAIAKKNFRDLVTSISTGNEGLTCYGADECLEDFKSNLVAYAEMYPDTMAAAVDASHMKFLGMEKDKDQFRANMEAYLAQFNPGSPPMNKQQLDVYFTSEQYEVFRNKFWKQTSSVISGDESHYFSPPHIVQDLMKTPEKLDTAGHDLSSFPAIPYSFGVLKNFYPPNTQQIAGGPVVGALISVTPDLKVAAEAVAKAKTLRQKAEAMAFLTNAQKDALKSAQSVAALAKEAGAPVVAMGGMFLFLFRVFVLSRVCVFCFMWYLSSHRMPICTSHLVLSFSECRIVARN